eukprot:GHVU01048603.1.p4 GENE.GHVU01048603.1~~GHVU01048603.1.p4  ORF type:complete len:100 (-),score=14.32 GHVU01048603.1:51-350(-)
MPTGLRPCVRASMKETTAPLDRRRDREVRKWERRIGKGKQGGRNVNTGEEEGNKRVSAAKEERGGKIWPTPCHAGAVEGDIMCPQTYMGVDEHTGGEEG